MRGAEQLLALLRQFEAAGVAVEQLDLEAFLEAGDLPAYRRLAEVQAFAGVGEAAGLGDGVTIRGALVKIGDVRINRDNWDWAEVDNNPFFSPDAEAVKTFEDLLDKTRKEGSSLGAIIEVTASGVPAGLGAPVYGKLDADLAGAMMGINAVKGVEIGAGFQAASLTGEENADEMRMEGGKVTFLSNNAGGVLGGISSGQDIVVCFAVKPTSSILKPKRTVDMDGHNAEVSTKGRHDPCVGIRAVPIGEA
ncbi:MAG: chorismate synthase, partial [Proteobacteria bacterium]|nr:chorismate synthase [Pseudomonadota bacterium]